ncbi:MAG: BCAM0308 family protein [Burkholderiaceae bacterium]|nr:BCAM0308 family protein [Burkholderiaceae bacterium]
MKSDPSSSTGFRSGQNYQLMGEVVRDPLQEREKMVEPVVCKNCQAVFRKGRWQWLTPPNNAHQGQCPACKRIQQKMPAGYVTIEGTFALEHRDELLQLIHHLENHEKAEHPLKRIMGIEQRDDGLLVTTTDIHLAHGIGEALSHAYKGELESNFNEADYLLRVHWRR